MKMIVSRDEISTFIPDRKPRMVILGTMGSICARTLNGVRPAEAFYYHNNKNNFWRILQLVFESHLGSKALSVEEKKNFLHRNRIAMANIVQEINVKTDEAEDPSDAVLFRANRKELLTLKSVTEEFRATLQTTPIYFTCRQKPEITKLLVMYFELNGLGSRYHEKVWHLPSPTRCSPQKRSIVWRDEIKKNGF